MSEQILDIQQGIWIDQDLLQQAGLSQSVKIILQEGEIRIQSALTEENLPTTDTGKNNWSQEAIEVFRSLGQEATSGKLENTSIHHDHYLYGKTE